MGDSVKGDLEQSLSILGLAEFLPEDTLLMQFKDHIVNIVLLKMEIEGIHDSSLCCQCSMRQLQVKHLHHRSRS